MRCDQIHPLLKLDWAINWECWAYLIDALMKKNTKEVVKGKIEQIEEEKWEKKKEKERKHINSIQLIYRTNFSISDEIWSVYIYMCYQVYFFFKSSFFLCFFFYVFSLFASCFILLVLPHGFPHLLPPNLNSSVPNGPTPTTRIVWAAPRCSMITSPLLLPNPNLLITHSPQTIF